jgi:hypothetical protein
MTTIMMALIRATHTTEAAVEALAVILGQKWSGDDTVINLRPRQMRFSTVGATSTPTYIKMAGENQHISSSNAMNSFD